MVCDCYVRPCQISVSAAALIPLLAQFEYVRSAGPSFKPLIIDRAAKLVLHCKSRKESSRRSSR